MSSISCQSVLRDIYDVYQKLNDSYSDKSCENGIKKCQEVIKEVMVGKPAERETVTNQVTLISNYFKSRKDRNDMLFWWAPVFGTSFLMSVMGTPAFFYYLSDPRAPGLYPDLIDFLGLEGLVNICGKIGLTGFVSCLVTGVYMKYRLDTEDKIKDSAKLAIVSMEQEYGFKPAEKESVFEFLFNQIKENATKEYLSELKKAVEKEVELTVDFKEIQEGDDVIFKITLYSKKEAVFTFLDESSINQACIARGKSSETLTEHVNTAKKDGPFSVEVNKNKREIFIGGTAKFSVPLKEHEIVEYLSEFKKAVEKEKEEGITIDFKEIQQGDDVIFKINLCLKEKGAFVIELNKNKRHLFIDGKAKFSVP